MKPREIMRRVRRLEIRTRRLVEESLAGSYHSVYRGRGMEFAEVREYVPGDDVRNIDWNVSARFGHPFMKNFTEERELSVLLAVDVSGSSRFGTAALTKVQMTAEISALLAFSAIRNHDRVGLLLFSDRIEIYVPPRKGKQHGLRVLRELLTIEPQSRGTDLAGALGFLQRVLTKRAVVFLLSDFQDRDFERNLGVSARKHDLVAIHVRDAREENLPPVGLIAVEDPESGERHVVDSSSPTVRRRWAAAFRGQREEARRVIRRCGVELLELSTAEPYEVPLVRFFHRRARRAAATGA